MATVGRWVSLGPPQYSRMVPGSMVPRYHLIYGVYLGRKGCCWTSRKWSRQRGSRVGVGSFDDTELTINGAANANEFGTLALLFSDSQDDDGSVADVGMTFNVPSEIDESNELYDKLAGNSLAGESRIGGADIEIDLEEEPDSEQGHIETWKEGIDNRIGKSAFQQASRLLEAVNKTLDGLEDGLVKHAENVAEESRQISRETQSQFFEVEQMREELSVRDNLLEMLWQEANKASLTLRTATQAMAAAEEKIVYLQEQLDMTAGSLQQEREATQRALDLFSNSLLALSDAEKRMRELEQQVEIGMHGSQVQESSTESLANQEEGVEPFTAEGAILQEEVHSRDVLLQEAKDDMVRSADSLKLASRIEQELRASMERELELTQNLESHKELVKELQQELAESYTATLADQALQHMEKMVKDLKYEVEILSDGLGAGDNASNIMSEKAGHRLGFLTNASENRESVRQLTSYVKELKAELTLKDEKIASLRSELSQAETALQQGRIASNSTPGVLTTAQSNKSAKRPNVEVKNLRRKSNRRRLKSSSHRSSPQS
ncbi:uncharacterized protein [Physcomitrium patens]|uniref:Uncharacterized protein n=1 Tax=Physcomitrium patens TaxID=3218 RepID=A9S3A2_PHYPA|nr:ELKS/Rab6-interacting/CAST family member 1-like isoform X2 [Physcomitrium patens]|eukprot:XP_024386231.1 ELKS/Rab6-interacting/CAST family member 1-like isoform X2 [Physcomitrella patens]